MVAGVWLVPVWQLANPVKMGSVVCLGAGQYEYLTCKRWDEVELSPSFEGLEGCDTETQGFVPVSHWPQSVTIVGDHDEFQAPNVMGYMPIGKYVKVIAVETVRVSREFRNGSWRQVYAERALVEETNLESSDEVDAGTGDDFDPDVWWFDQNRVPETGEDHLEEPEDANSALESCDPNGCVVYMKTDDGEYAGVVRHRVWIDSVFLYPDPVMQPVT